MNENRFPADAGVLAIKTNTMIAEQEQAERLRAEADKAPVRTALLDFCEKQWQTNRDARDSAGVTEMLRDAMRRRQGEYDAAMKTKLEKEGVPVVWAPVTETQCLAGEAWLTDIDMTVNERSWTLSPTPVPDLPQQIEQRVMMETMQKAYTSAQESGQPLDMQQIQEMHDEIADDMESEIEKEAREIAQKMRESMIDDLVEGKWNKVKKDFRSMTLTYGTGVLKGPLVEMRKKISWAGSEPTITEEPKVICKTVNPLDAYPSPNAENPEDGHFIETYKLSRADVEDLKDIPAYDADEIDALLAEQPEGSIDDANTDTDRLESENKQSGQDNPEGDFEFKELWGCISGKMLSEHGVEDIDDDKSYEFQVIWCDTHILKVMPMPDPLGRTVYHVARYKRVTGSFWGKGVPHLCKTDQDICNSSVRSLVANMGIASGPQVDIDMNQIPEKMDITKMTPWKIWPTKSKSGAGRPAIVFFQPDDRSGKLIAVFEHFTGQAEKATGIPPYMYGSDEASGAGKTASGLSMLINAAARGMKDSLGNMDEAIVSLMIQFYVWKMLYDPRDDIKGDCCVEIKGTMGVLLMELRQARITEFLDRLLHPDVQQLVGPEYIIKTMHEYAELLQLDHENLLPSVQEVMKRVKANAEMQQQLQQAEAAKEQAEVGRTQAETQLQAAEQQRKGQRDDEELTIKRRELQLKEAEAVAGIERQLQGDGTGRE